ncbi:MAG: PEP-CTERM sorting domain-containing protein [Nitrosomonadales bacterium]|nr:PEP-CTERM sorting domain-containing protein [Nitrosomonadales bacterium]
MSTAARALEKQFEHGPFFRLSPIVVVDPPPVTDPPPIAAILEPATYAMMLAGLGLLGLVARRRKQRLVALLMLST